jgi:hypothetical protein
MKGQDAVEYPVVSVHDSGPFHVQDPRQVPYAERIGKWQVMLSFTCVDAWQSHRHRAEPVHSYTRGEHFDGRGPLDVLRRDCDLVPTRSEDVSKIEYVSFLAADIRREELSGEQDAH